MLVQVGTMILTMFKSWYDIRKVEYNGVKYVQVDVFINLNIMVLNIFKSWVFVKLNMMALNMSKSWYS